MIIEAITAAFDAIKQIFSTVETNKNEQAHTVIIKDRSNYHKAIDYAEKIIFIVDKYDTMLSQKDQKQYKWLREKFFKYN